MIVVPLRDGHANVGVLKVLSPHAHAFDEQDVHTLQLMAGLIGAAINHAAEFEARLDLMNGRTSALKALEKEQEFLQAVLENISDGIVACNAEGVLTLFNRATREFHNLPAEPLSPEKWADYYDLYLADGKTHMSREEIPLSRALQVRRYAKWKWLLLHGKEWHARSSPAGRRLLTRKVRDSAQSWRCTT
jgi:PAS domain-containing protein